MKKAKNKTSDKNGTKAVDQASDEEVDVSSSSRAGVRGSDQEHLPEPFRESVATLATQIVAAQIQGIAQFEMLSSFWREFRSSMIAVAAHLDECHQPSEGGNGPSVRLRDQLLRTRTSIPKPDVLRPVGFSDIEAIRDSALNYAERLLMPHDVDDQPILAEQMFEMTEELSENEIFERFKKSDWPSLTSRGSVRNLMRKIDSWFSNWVEGALAESSEKDSSPPSNGGLSNLSILIRAKKILEAEGVNTDNFADPIRKKSGVPVTQIPRIQIRDLDLDMIRYLYCDESPVDRHVVRTSSDTGKAAPRRYRPWGVFRYLRLFGKDELAATLNKGLRAQKDKLERSCFPDALYPDLYEMRAVEQRLEDSRH
ncbi:MAG: hypothetical protein ACJAVK_000311 [Akkermansiaceae bacterium]